MMCTVQMQLLCIQIHTNVHRNHANGVNSDGSESRFAALKAQLFIFISIRKFSSNSNSISTVSHMAISLILIVAAFLCL